MQLVAKNYQYGENTCYVGACVQVSSALLKGSLEEDEAMLQSGAVSSGGDERTAAAVVSSLTYLRDRVSLRHHLSAKTNGRDINIHTQSRGVADFFPRRRRVAPQIDLSPQI